MMNRALTAIIAAAGLLGCARDVPVYDQLDVLAQGNGFTTYTRVFSDAEKLYASVFASSRGQTLEEVKWTTHEANDSARCISEEIYAFSSQQPGSITMFDDLCDGTVDRIDYMGTPVTRDEIGNSMDLTFEYAKGQIDSVLNLNRLIEEWRARRGV